MRPDRSTVFTCLLHVMPTEFGQLEQAPRDLAGLVISDVCAMIESEGWTDVYRAAQEFARRVTPEDREPGYLTRYAEGLLAQEERRSQVIPGTLVYLVTYSVRGVPIPRRTATVVIGGVAERNPTTLGDIPRILSVKLWGSQDASRIYIISMALDFTRSDLSDND